MFQLLNDLKARATKEECEPWVWGRVGLFLSSSWVPLERDPEQRIPWAFTPSQFVHKMFMCPVCTSWSKGELLSGVFQYLTAFSLHVYLGRPLMVISQPEALQGLRDWVPLSEDTQSLFPPLLSQRKFTCTRLWAGSRNVCSLGNWVSLY